MGLRPVLVRLHRWAGLTIAGFLIVAGVTGVALPFRTELEWLCAPALWSARPPSSSARPLPGPELAQRVARSTGGQPVQVPLDIDGHHAVSMFIFARAGEPALGYDRVIVDPFTGAVRARLRYGVVEQFPRDLPTFLLALHYGYVLGDVGRLAFGIAALIWLIDAVTALVLTFPLRRRNAPVANAWWRRWSPAWMVRRHARGHKLVFDLHRAGGLWLWLPLLVFAWSAFSMNLPAVHGPLAAALGAEQAFAPARLPVAEATPRLGYVDAARQGAAHMARLAALRHFGVLAPARLDYRPAAGAWRYTARTTLDIGDTAATSVWISSTTGDLLGFQAPAGPSAIQAIDAWADAIHEAQILGLSYRVFVSLLGVLVTALSLTGVLIWMRKRSALAAAARAPHRPSPGSGS